MAHVDHGAIRIEVIAGPVDLGHVCAAQTAETLDLNFMTASLFDDQAGRICGDLLALADAPLLELALGGTVKLGICSFVLPVIFVDPAPPVELVFEYALLLLDRIAGFLEEFRDDDRVM
ncbi:hypothetical protein HG531_004899 [Fusarium graminearum]|nr:hypothetical protein HG531_004899 [Fusarium graminearum]